MLRSPFNSRKSGSEDENTIIATQVFHTEQEIDGIETEAPKEGKAEPETGKEPDRPKSSKDEQLQFFERMKNWMHESGTTGGEYLRQLLPVSLWSFEPLPFRLNLFPEFLRKLPVFPRSETSQSESAILPPLPFDAFLATLREKRAKELRDALTDFQTSFVQQLPTLPVAAQGQHFHAFVDSLMNSLVPSLWPPAEWEVVGECLEKFLTENLFQELFTPTPDHVTRDATLAERIHRLQFLQPTHFDIPAKFVPVAESDVTQDALRSINSVKSPRDKLRWILIAVKHIFDGLREAKPSDLTESPGVDDFIPVFIFVILRANPPCLHSTISYLSHFRHPSHLEAEVGYYFVSFLTAVSFIETMSPSVLSIDPALWDTHMNNPSSSPPSPSPSSSSSSNLLEGTSTIQSSEETGSESHPLDLTSQQSLLNDQTTPLTSPDQTQETIDWTAVKKLLEKSPAELSVPEVELLQLSLRHFLS